MEKYNKKYAVCNEIVGQLTQFLPIDEVLSFPQDNRFHHWFIDESGNNYSLYDLLIRVWK